MNSVNSSLGLSNFQLRLGQSPCLIPPIIPDVINAPMSKDADALCAHEVISKMQDDLAEAKDNLLQAKIFQTHYTNQNRSPDIPFKIGDKVMLSTLHRHQEFKKKGEKRAAKFFPRYDGPYDVINVHTETSNYTLKLPNSPNTYPTYHASELKPFLPNDTSLFPSRELAQPHPILTTDSLEEYFIQEIIDSCQHGKAINT
jgi:hypothetical protein